MKSHLKSEEKALHAADKKVTAAQRRGKQTKYTDENGVVLKRPMTGYLRWTAENRERLMEAAGTKDVTAISRKAGAEWKALSDAERKPYDDVYYTELAVFKEQLAAAKKAGREVVGGKKRSRSPTKVEKAAVPAPAPAALTDDSVSSDEDSEPEEKPKKHSKKHKKSSKSKKHKKSSKSKKHKRRRHDSFSGSDGSDTASDSD